MQNRLNPATLQMPQSGIRRIAEAARAIPGCISLTLGEPAFDTPLPIRERTTQALAEGHTHYPPNQGIPALRASIAAFESRHYHTPLSAEDILITTGSTEAIACALLAILSPGDELIVPQPAFGLYAQQVLLSGATLVPLDTTPCAFQIDEAALAACITPRTKAILLNTPNNPTGAVYTQQSIDAVTRLCIRHNLFLILDAVYDRLAFLPAVPTPDSALLEDRLIRINAFSKPYAMTGWRIGYAIAAPHILTPLARVHAALTVGVSTFSQVGCVDIFDNPVDAMRETYRANRDLVMAKLTPTGMPLVRPDGAFYAFPSIKQYGLSDDAFVQGLLQKHKVAVVPGDCFGAPGYIRISFCGDRDALTEGLDRIAAYVRAL